MNTAAMTFNNYRNLATREEKDALVWRQINVTDPASPLCRAALWFCFKKAQKANKP